MIHYQTKEKLKKIQCPFIKSSPFSLGNFPPQKKEFIMHLLLKKCKKKKHTFFEWIFNQKL
jgi:hypothetical protein